MNTLTILRKYSASALGLTMLIIAFSDISAQVKLPAYTRTTFSGGYSSIKGDGISCTFLSGADDGTATSGTGGVTNLLTLPFNFVYDGVTLSTGATVMFSSNGFLVLGATSSAVPDGTRYGVADNVNNAIMPFSGDLVLGGGAGYYEIQGASPNRVAVYEWSNFYIYGYSTYTTNGMQVRLYESSNTVEFLYNNPGYAFSGTKLNATGDPCAFWVGLNGNPAASDNNYYSSNLSALPPSNIRFTFVVPLNIQLSTSPKTVDFGFGLTGQIVDRQVTITHAGTEGTLTVSSIIVTGNSDFSVLPPLPSPLDVGQSATITVRFIAQVDGVRSGTLTIVSNGKDSGAQSILLKATGVAPNITVDSNVRFKKTRTRLGDSLTQWVHISAVGQASLFFFTFPISGIDADQYFISHFPTNPLAPGQVDSLSITYVPTREGLRAATLTINSNAANAPSLPITLRGTGILPHIVVTPSPLLFDSTAEGDTVCKQISIWNSGTDTLRLSANVLSSNDGDFHYTGLSGTDMTIAPDHTKNVSICFIPIQQGFRQARLLLKTNIIKTFETPRRDTASTVAVDIRGSGVPLGVFANSISGLPVLDSALIGVQVCRTDTLWNKGDADILITGATFTGGVFTQTGLSFPFTLKSRTFKTFTLCGTPDVEGIITGSLTIAGTTSGRVLALNLPLGIFGLKACASPLPLALFLNTKVVKGTNDTMCTTVTNCGTIAASYTASISGGDAADYTILSQNPSPVIPPQGTYDFCVKFNDPSVGGTAASLDIKSSGVTDMNIPLTGEGACANVIATPDAVPNTGVLGKSTFDVAIANTGNFDWTAGTGNVAPSDGVFSVISLDKPTAPAGSGSITVHMQFAPVTLGNASAILTFPAAGPCEVTPINVTLNGVGIVNSVKEITASEGFRLEQSYPNPSSGNIWFNYTTPRETEVRISLADLTGNLVRTLITGRVSEGAHIVNFDGRDLPSGTYIYILESGSIRLARQLILTK